ncbi:MAG: type II toxin-antitoxin system Phd/YefM family antitoxin [Deltaproteobacteria bacterium]|nr:type II toxin-antitoxin system Phd/YefM family antitoxin [Deltaproteobacteria bacterium]
MTKRMGVGAVKAQLTAILRDVEAHRARVVIDRRGRPVAMLVPYDEASATEAEPHWAAELDGVASDVHDFDSTMRDVVRSRRRARPRAVDLG